MQSKEFKATFASYSTKQISWFFETSKVQLIRPKETELHARNKLLLSLDKLHNSLSGQQMRSKYKIGVKTAHPHVQVVLKTIVVSYQDVNVVRFPTEEERLQMIAIL